MRRGIFLTFASMLSCAGPVQTVDCVSSASAGLESGTAETAIPDLEKGAYEGDERCKFILGMWSLSGTGTEQDSASAGRWLSEAAEAGLPVAQSNLGLLHSSGVGVKKDAAQAARWCRAAAIRGDPLGQAALGAACFLGAGVPRDLVEAYMWTSLGADQGNEKARTYLPAIEAAMTARELKRSKAKVAAFSPNSTPRRRQMTQRDVLRAIGVNRALIELDRFDGAGF